MDENHVSVNVIEYSKEDETRYLLAQSAKDRKWEFIGGKYDPDEDETIEDTAVRESWEEFRFRPEPVETGEPYPSQRDPDMTLVPVYMHTDTKDVKIRDEHLDYEWITLDEFEDYDTEGQRKALERLGLV